MRTRLRKITNFLAFNLLFFALYLNFIHQDKQLVTIGGDQKVKPTAAAFSGTVLVQDQQKYVPHSPVTAGRE